MTTDRELERLLDSWLTDGPTVVADRVIDGVASRIVRQPQRPAWRLRPWRFPTMSTQLRFAILAGALLVAALAGGVLLLGGGGRSSPTATPGVAPTAAASSIAFRAESHLAAGTYANQFAAGRLTFTLPAGWSSADASQFDFTLHLDGGPAADTVKVFTDMRRASKGAACAEAPQADVGATADLISADLGGDADLAVTDAGSIGLDGLTGRIVDVALAPGATRTCPFSGGKPSIPLVVDLIPGEGAFWGIGPNNERIRLVLLDAARGHNVVVVLDSATGESFDAVTAATMPIVRSFAFEAGDPLPPLPACEDALFGCAGPLAASSHQSVAFQPSLAFTTPVGWTNVIDTPTIFKLNPTSASDPSLVVWSNVAIPDGCGPAILSGSGTKLNDFVDFVTHHPGIQVLSNTQGVVGRWPARVLDLRVKDTYTEGCAGVPGNAVQFLVDTDPLAGTPVYGVASGGRTHIVVVDVNGRTVIVQAFGTDSDAGLAFALATVQPLIDTFQFTPAN